jgi:hypothetical protein
MINNNATCPTELYMAAPFSLPPGFLEFKASGSVTTNDPCLGIERIVMSIACMSHEIAELLSTVRAEALPLAVPPTLLGVLLPEGGVVGFGEKRSTNWLG